MALAVANYEARYGHYPPAFIADVDGTPMHSWQVLILPFLVRQSLYEQYDFSQPWNSEANLKLAEQMPSFYAFHGESGPGLVTTNYLAVVGQDTLWPGRSGRSPKDVSDKFSQTIMLVENAGAAVHWMEPRDLDYDAMSFRVNSPSGVSSKYLVPAVALLDGSLRRLEEGLPEDVLRALLTIDGGEQISDVGETWRLLPDGRHRNARQQHESSH